MRVELRPIRDDDLARVFEWHRDPASVAMAGVPPRERAAFDAHWAKLRAEPSNVLRMILADAVPVGWAQSWRGEGARFVGYWIARDAWGRGIATQALALLLREVDERPLRAIVRAQNAASRRALERAGFVALGEHEPGVLRYELE